MSPFLFGKLVQLFTLGRISPVERTGNEKEIIREMLMKCIAFAKSMVIE